MGAASFSAWSPTPAWTSAVEVKTSAPSRWASAAEVETVVEVDAKAAAEEPDARPRAVLEPDDCFGLDAGACKGRAEPVEAL